MLADTQAVDYYEFLQISRTADPETIHRVYRFLAGRYHPDNPETGNSEKFSLLRTAYEVLSDPMRRSEYDVACETETPPTAPLSQVIDFMDQLEGELNRRLAVLSVLYFRRRTSPYAPEVSLVEIESRMGFPRDYLDFTMWYLTKKGYITKADNSDFTLTAQGVDFIETQRANIPALNKLLTSGTETATAQTQADAGHTLNNGTQQPIIVLPDMTYPKERRLTSRDRRTNRVDRRANQIDRRKSPQ